MTDEQELEILKVRDGLIWLEEASLNMRKRLDAKGDFSIGRESDTTALYIKGLLEAEKAKIVAAVDEARKK